MLGSGLTLPFLALNPAPWEFEKSGKSTEEISEASRGC